MRVRVAWVLFGATVLAAVLHVVVLVLEGRPLLSEPVMSEGFPLVTVGALGGAFVGALIISRYPGHPIGWLFLVGQLLSELGVALGAYGHAALAGDLDPAPGGHLAVWLSVQTGGLFVVAMLGVLFLLAPDGRLASRRWSAALVLTVAGLLVHAAAVTTVSPRELDPVGQLRGEPGPVLAATLAAATVAVLVGVVAGAVSMWRRLRRATGEEREQLQLMVLAALGLVIGLAINTAAALLGGPEWLQNQPLMAAYACVPVLTAVAILRYRLYDIDLFLNRAITLTILTGFITLGYVAVVVVIGTALPFARDLFWPSLLATALVALAAQPARERVERLAARLVYGARAAPYVELAEFSKRLQESPGTEQLLLRVAESVVRAVGARRATIVVEASARSRIEVTWPGQSARALGETTTVPVVDAAEPLGLLSVTMPPRTSLRPEEERLLADFAAQLAGVFRNLRLESALAVQVRRLDAGTAELEASGRRLAVARDAERARFDTQLTRDVVPHLSAVREGLRALLSADQLPGTPERFDALGAEVQAALESLRGLTRGVFPAQLDSQGLVPALQSHLARRPSVSGSIRADPASYGRFDRRIESVAYFCVVELLRELEAPVLLVVTTTPGLLEVQVSGAAPTSLSGRIEHLQDRAAVLDGTLSVDEAEGQVRMVLRLPIHPTSHPAADASATGQGPDLPEAVRAEVGLGEVGLGAAP